MEMTLTPKRELILISLVLSINIFMIFAAYEENYETSSLTKNLNIIDHGHGFNTNAKYPTPMPTNWKSRFNIASSAAEPTLLPSSTLTSHPSIYVDPTLHPSHYFQRMQYWSRGPTVTTEDSDSNTMRRTRRPSTIAPTKRYSQARLWYGNDLQTDISSPPQSHASNSHVLHQPSMSPSEGPTKKYDKLKIWTDEMDAVLDVPTVAPTPYLYHLATKSHHPSGSPETRSPTPWQNKVMYGSSQVRRGAHNAAGATEDHLFVPEPDTDVDIDEGHPDPGELLSENVGLSESDHVPSSSPAAQYRRRSMTPFVDMQEGIMVFESPKPTPWAVRFPYPTPSAIYSDEELVDTPSPSVPSPSLPYPYPSSSRRKYSTMQWTREPTAPMPTTAAPTLTPVSDPTSSPSRRSFSLSLGQWTRAPSTAMPSTTTPSTVPSLIPTSVPTERTGSPSSLPSRRSYTLAQWTRAPATESPSSSVPSVSPTISPSSSPSRRTYTYSLAQWTRAPSVSPYPTLDSSSMSYYNLDSPSYRSSSPTNGWMSLLPEKSSTSSTTLISSRYPSPSPSMLKSFQTLMDTTTSFASMKNVVMAPTSWDQNPNHAPLLASSSEAMAPTSWDQNPNHAPLLASSSEAMAPTSWDQNPNHSPSSFEGAEIPPTHYPTPWLIGAGQRSPVIVLDYGASPKPSIAVYPVLSNTTSSSSDNNNSSNSNNSSRSDSVLVSLLEESLTQILSQSSTNEFISTSHPTPSFMNQVTAEHTTHPTPSMFKGFAPSNPTDQPTSPYPTSSPTTPTKPTEFPTPYLFKFVSKETPTMNPSPSTRGSGSADEEASPTLEPTAVYTPFLFKWADSPTDFPTEIVPHPTHLPTEYPTRRPTHVPSHVLTASPSSHPSMRATETVTVMPSFHPTPSLFSQQTHATQHPTSYPTPHVTTSTQMANLETSSSSSFPTPSRFHVGAYSSLPVHLSDSVSEPPSPLPTVRAVQVSGAPTPTHFNPGNLYFRPSPYPVISPTISPAPIDPSKSIAPTPWLYNPHVDRRAPAPTLFPTPYPVKMSSAPSLPAPSLNPTLLIKVSEASGVSSKSSFQQT
eukprot:gene6557-13261_t